MFIDLTANALNNYCALTPCVLEDHVPHVWLSANNYRMTNTYIIWQNWYCELMTYSWKQQT